MTLDRLTDTGAVWLERRSPEYLSKAERYAAQLRGRRNQLRARNWSYVAVVVALVVVAVLWGVG